MGTKSEEGKGHRVQISVHALLRQSRRISVDDGGGSSGEKVLRLRPTALNRSWEFCARTKTEGKRALLRNSPEVPGTGGLRTSDLNTTEVAAPEHTCSAYTFIRSS